MSCSSDKLGIVGPIGGRRVVDHERKILTQDAADIGHTLTRDIGGADDHTPHASLARWQEDALHVIDAIGGAGVGHGVWPREDIALVDMSTDGDLQVQIVDQLLARARDARCIRPRQRDAERFGGIEYLSARPRNFGPTWLKNVCCGTGLVVISGVSIARRVDSSRITRGT